MQNKLRLFIGAAALISCAAALAESTSEALTRIEAETLLLKAREKQLEVQANIVNKENEIASKQGTNNLIANSAVPGDPMVRSVEGLGKAMFATLQLHDGGMIDVQRGDRLPNGMQVISIAPSEVIVQTAAKKRLRL